MLLVIEADARASHHCDLGGIGPEMDNVLFMKRTADRLFGEDYVWSVLAAGRHQIPVATQAAMLSGNVRVGREDSLFIGRGRIAASNAEQVRKVRQILEELGHEVATPAMRDRCSPSREVTASVSEVSIKHKSGRKNMTQSVSRRALPAVPSLVLALAGLAAVVDAAELIRIGAIPSTTGPGAGAGIPQRNGLQLAGKLANEKGGIDGRQIQLIIEDGGPSPGVAVTKANNLIFSHEVPAIIGPTLTASTLAVGGVADPAKIPVMAFTGLGVPAPSV